MTSPALKVTEINHVALLVTDLERSRRFYMEILGFEDRTRQVNPSQAASPHQTMSFLVAGSQGLDLFENSGAGVQAGREMNHMALTVEEQDVSAVRAALEQAGVQASEPTPRNTVFISDPDGHGIEILPRQAGLFHL
jgi:catechol 2,3-dioxygenase-like lactoylglutathione lyase family enzyme